ncbi:MAG: NAD(+)/NADH kinase [Deltaproteobacteria bacterium]|nr:NAD(+)/NADH kinase [Deltaproteobacteria bacterium]
MEILVTTGAGDAVNMARSLDAAVDRLVVAGGDGTISEVLNGLVDPSRIPILHIPTGTANMLARDLGLPFRPDALADVAESGLLQRMDMGLIGSHRFLFLVTAGFDATVTRELRAGRGRRLGYRGYIAPILKALSRYEPVDLEVTVDGGEKVEGRQVMVLNVRHYGGLFVFSETSRPDSGHLDVCVFRGGSALSLVRYSLAGFLGLASRLPDMTLLSGTCVRIESRTPCPLEVDGDYFGHTPAEIELVKAVVPILVPAPQL